MDADALFVGAGAAAGDLRFPSGVAPLSIAAAASTTENANVAGEWTIKVQSAAGAEFDLAHPGNRVLAEVPLDAGVTVRANGSRVSIMRDTNGQTDRRKVQVRLVYQRARANATAPWADVTQFKTLGGGDQVETSIWINV